VRNLISRHGLSKIEKAVSIARKPSKEGKRQLLQYSRHQAQYHATAVAAIVLSGRPKIDEPLNIAWSRALQHYRIKLGKWGEIDHQVRAAKRLFPAIIGENQIEARLTEIFRTAPFWLLQFTGIAMDARLLNFRVPDISRRPFIWGSVGYQDARSWPLLPVGTMMAGDPIPNIDERRVWLALFCQVTAGGILDEDGLPSQEKEARISRNDKKILADFSFALDLDRKPEEEWTPYEMRRMRRVSKVISRLG
jgi:hypothetical protein